MYGQLDWHFDRWLCGRMVSNDPKTRPWERRDAKFLGLEPLNWPFVIATMLYWPIYWWLGIVIASIYAVIVYGGIGLAVRWVRRNGRAHFPQ